MRCRLHQTDVLGGYLARLGDLQLLHAALVAHPERAAARFALIAYHAADAHRAVEHRYHCPAVAALGQLAAQLVREELHRFVQPLVAAQQRLDQLVRAALQAEQLAGQYLFI